MRKDVKEGVQDETDQVHGDSIQLNKRTTSFAMSLFLFRFVVPKGKGEKERQV